jgi:N-acetylmuramoyl-L-alanine amidase
MIGMASIYLDASNQKENVGVGSYGNEAIRMNYLADRVKYYLDQGHGGIAVYRNNINMTLTQTVNHANSLNTDVYLALHTNAGGGKGTEIYHYPNSANGLKLAQMIYNKVAPITVSADRGIKTNDWFYVIKNTVMEAVLIEIMFHDNLTDVNDYLSKIETIAQAIAKGIYQFFGINYASVCPTCGKPW